MFDEYQQKIDDDDRYGLKECSILLSAGFIVSFLLSLGLSLG